MNSEKPDSKKASKKPGKKAVPDAPKRAGGAPTKWRDEFPQMLIEHMRQGKSLRSFAAKIGVSVETLNVWANDKPELSEAKKRGEALSFKWWEDMGMRAMQGKVKGFNPVVWIFAMKNRFGWRDQPPVEARDDVPEPTLNYQPRKARE